MSLGWGGADAGPASYAAVLSNAEVVIRALAVGVDGLSRWSFTNRGDLDGQWQLVRTWDCERKVHLEEVLPEPAPYYGFGALTRFVAKGSRVVECRLVAPPGVAPEVLAAALVSPGRRLTVLVLNPSTAGIDASLEVRAAPSSDLHVYKVEEARLGPSLRMDPLTTLDPNRTPEVRPPARSLTVVTGFGLRHEDDGVTTERDGISGNAGRDPREGGPAVRE